MTHSSFPSVGILRHNSLIILPRAQQSIHQRCRTHTHTHLRDLFLLCWRTKRINKSIYRFTLPLPPLSPQRCPPPSVVAGLGSRLASLQFTKLSSGCHWSTLKLESLLLLSSAFCGVEYLSCVSRFPSAAPLFCGNKEK